MNLEGKQQIWNDYQKEIADDRYYYARSCIRQTFFPGSEWAYLDILNNKLGKTVLDDPRHTTCTGIGYHSDVVPIETIMTVVENSFSQFIIQYIQKSPFGPWKKSLTLLHYFFRYLYRNPAYLGDSSRMGRKDPGIFMESNETGIPKAEEPGTYFRCHL